jgi:hypothetical protein
MVLDNVFGRQHASEIDLEHPSTVFISNLENLTLLEFVVWVNSNIFIQELFCL